MVMRVDSTRPFALATRRRVGAACARQARTVADLVRLFGTKDGSIRQTVVKMEKEGVLSQEVVPHSQSPGYRLKPECQADLEAALTSRSPPGQLEPGQRLVFFPANDLDLTTRAVAQLADLAAWGGRIQGGSIYFVLAFDADVDSTIVDGATAALDAAGQRRELGLVERLFDPLELLDYSAAVQAVRSQREITS
jgi:hypothetical protein